MDKISHQDAKDKGLNKYFTGIQCKHGHVCERYTKNRYCCECQAAASVKWATDNPERNSEVRRTAARNYIRKFKEEDLELYKSYKSAADKKYHDKNKPNKAACALYRKNHPEKILLRSAKCRAKKKSWDFNITEEDIIIPEFCPVLGIPIFKNNGQGACDNSATIDRVDSSKGYVTGNVWVISNRANRIKNDSTVEELELILKALKERGK